LDITDNLQEGGRLSVISRQLWWKTGRTTITAN